MGDLSAKKPRTSTWERLITSGSEEAQPFLLVEVRQAEIMDAAIEGGCFVREHPWVKLEARIMKDANNTALQVHVTTRKATSMAVPIWN